MCRRFSLIYNIHTTSIDEIYDYLRRLCRIYVVMLVVTIIQVALGNSSRSLPWAIVGIVLYAANTAAIFYVSNHKDRQLWHIAIPFVTTLLNCAFNIAMLVVQVMDGNLWALLNLISVIIQTTTLYIFYMLRRKMLEEENQQLVPDSSLSNKIHEMDRV
jgi:hypothetical protein